MHPSHRMRLSCLLACCLLVARSGAVGIIGNSCSASAPQQTWSYEIASGFLRSATAKLCLTADADPVTDGTGLSTVACGGNGTDPRSQSFDIIASNNTLVLRANHTQCVNLAGYGTAPGTPVWLYGCSPPAYECQNNCDWEGADGGSHLRNAESGLCLDDGFRPPQARTCDPESPSYGLPFCDNALPFEERAADLVARLSLEYKASLLMLPFPVNGTAGYVDAGLNLAGFGWDVTAIHGLSSCCGFIDPLPNASSFPHAIAQAASFDLSLAARIASAVALEARIVSQRNMAASGNRSLQALHAEGGPLANTVHDPRVSGVLKRAVE